MELITVGVVAAAAAMLSPPKIIVAMFIMAGCSQHKAPCLHSSDRRTITFVLLNEQPPGFHLVPSGRRKVLIVVPKNRLKVLFILLSAML
jgi:hypothetical protein